jgi:microcompartment protein CcmL/EutN
MTTRALGLIETKGLTGAIEACDAAANAGEVVIASAEPMASGHMTVKIEGERSAVREAVNAGARAAQKIGELVSIHMIPRSDDGVNPLLPYGRFLKRYDPDQETAEPTKQSQPAKPAAKPAVAPRKPKPPRKAKPAPEVTAPPTPDVALVGDEPEADSTPTPAPIPVAELAAESVKRAELESMPVVKLRQFARTIKDLPIQGRQISMANKTDLLAAIGTVLDLE